MGEQTVWKKRGEERKKVASTDVSGGSPGGRRTRYDLFMPPVPDT